MHAQSTADQRRGDGERAQHKQRAQAQAAHRRARVLPGRAIPVRPRRAVSLRRPIGVLACDLAHTYAFIGVCARVLNKRAGVATPTGVESAPAA